MADKNVLGVIEDGTYSTAAPNPHVDLAGTMPSNAYIGQLFDTVLDTGETVTVTVRKDEDNWAVYEGVAFTAGTPDELDLNGGTLIDSAGTISNSDSVEVLAFQQGVTKGFGTAFPVAADFIGGAIPDGFRFYRQDRQVLYVYEQAWMALAMFNGATLYVEAGETGDGWGTGSDAAGSIQDALDQVPNPYEGDVVINVEAGTFSDAVNVRKAPNGDYSLTIQGTLTSSETGSSATLVQGSGATQGTLTHANVDGAYANKLLHVETDDDYRIVDSVASTTATIVGTFNSATTQDYTLYDWGTSLTGDFYIHPGSVSVTVKNLKTSGTILRPRGRSIVVENCWAADSLYLSNGGECEVLRSYIQPTANYAINASDHSNLRMEHSKAHTTTASGKPVFLQGMSYANIGYGNVFDGGSGANAVGVHAQSNSAARFYSGSALGYARVRNTGAGGSGVKADLGGQAFSTSNNQYSGNTTNEDGVSASYGYID